MNLPPVRTRTSRIGLSVCAGLAAFGLFWVGAKNLLVRRDAEAGTSLRAVEFAEPTPVTTAHLPTSDPGAGRFVSYDNLRSVAIRLTQSSTGYEVTGGRFNEVGGQRIVGTYTPEAHSIQGKFLFSPEGGSALENGFSTFQGSWDSKDQFFLVVEDQGDAQLTYRFSREAPQATRSR